MFSVPRVNVIASDEGFSVEVLGRTGLRYVEGRREVRIDAEVVMDGIAIYASSMSTWSIPDAAEPIDDRARAIIVDNIRRAFASQGHAVDVF